MIYIIIFLVIWGLQSISLESQFKRYVAVNHENDTCFGNGLVMGYADCKCLAGLVETSNVVSTFVRHTASGCLIFPAFMLTHVASLQFLPMGQYGLCFGYCFSGALSLRSHKEQVTFSGPFLGVPSFLDYTRNRPDPS